jgi:LacI family transcriptional regulator
MPHVICLDSGYKRIAHITSPPNISITKERFAGYSKAQEEAGIAITDDYIKYCPTAAAISAR